MAETEEGLWMWAKEGDRLKVLHEVRKRYITQRQAAAEFGIRVHWVRTLRVHGDRGPRRVHVEQAHVWRARCARYGELVQWDTSEHNWLEGADSSKFCQSKRTFVAGKRSCGCCV